MYCTGKDFSRVPLRTGHPKKTKYSGWAVLGCRGEQEWVCKCEDVYMHISTHILLIQYHV